INGDEKILNKSIVLAKAAKLLGLPILVSRQYPQGLGDTHMALLDALGEHDNTDKIEFSCMRDGSDKGVPRKLENLGQRVVIIAGVETHICVQQTVLDMLASGYLVYVLADCCGSRNEADHQTALQRMGLARDNGTCIITTLESVLFDILGTAAHPSRKEIQSLIK
ncbi:MAG: isochorismatase family protein, partial [Defluviitaleaceae bacterium]|nr:isochorismatase family protein [Defluviitaleaceae bacterium]